ncbi:hypothetical protein S83_029072, partial [Arachis hypogaea]
MDVMSEALRACQKTSMRWIHHLKMRIRELMNVVLAVPKIQFLFLGGCGEAYYCSTSGAEADWESSHSLLYTGERSDPAHREALLKFNKHANVAMSIKIGTVDFRDDIVIWARKKTGSSVIRINSKKKAEKFLTKYHTFVIGRFDKFEGHEYDEFVRAAKLDNEPEIYTAYGTKTNTKVVVVEMKNGIGLEIGGDMNLAAGIQHWQNKKQQQRIIVFAGSPVKHEKKVLEMIGRKLKKNNVALDIVNFGEEDEGKTEKLEALLAAVNNNDTSHIVHVPTGTNALSDVLISTPIFTGNGEGGSGFAAAAAAAAAGGVSGFEFGVDPNLDPELALALRVSMEEERARQEATTKKAAEEASKQEKGGEQQANSQDATMTERASASASEAETKTNDMM